MGEIFCLSGNLAMTAVLSFIFMGTLSCVLSGARACKAGFGRVFVGIHFTTDRTVLAIRTPAKRLSDTLPSMHVPLHVLVVVLFRVRTCSCCQPEVWTSMVDAQLEIWRAAYSIS